MDNELTAERLAELREMLAKATPGHVTDDKYACMVYADRTETALAAALHNSASALFDLAQEALDAREAKKNLLAGFKDFTPEDFKAMEAADGKTD